MVEHEVQDPEPSVPRLESLAERVMTGDVVLPKFQRQFVWTRPQVLNLLDSVARNYPIGSVLLWQTMEQDLASERTIGGLAVGPPRHGYPVNYVLDGQQRLATVCGALFWRPNGDPESQWNIGYDLDRQEFQHLNTLDDPPVHVVPVRLLSAPSAYFSRVAAISDQRMAKQASVLFDRFSNYQVAVVTLRGMGIAEVGKIFERINSTQTPLTIVELTRAATWSQQFDLKDQIDTLMGVLDRKNYGHIDDVTMLRTIATSAGFGFARTDMQRLQGLAPAALQAAVSDAAAAALRAVDFLATDIGTPRAVALPYMNQFAVLVEIFRQIPVPSSSQRVAIRRWFWLTASGEYFKGWNARQMVEDREAIAAFAQGLSNIDVNASLPIDKLWMNSQFRPNTATSKVLGLLLADAGPIDLRSGQRIDTGKALSWQNDKEFHHFFPKAFLKSTAVGPSRANACANLIMLTSVTNIYISDQRPSMYLKELCDMDGENEVRHRLASCLVDDDAYEAARRDDYPAFIEARSRTLHQRLLQLIGHTTSSGPHRVVSGLEADLLPEDTRLVDRDSVD